jgi:hypothetical protein
MTCRTRLVVGVGSRTYDCAMDDVEDDEFEPLECVRLPVAIEAYDVDVGGPSTVRLFFRMPGGFDPEPGGGLSEVVVLEQWDRVAIAWCGDWSTATRRTARSMVENCSYEAPR